MSPHARSRAESRLKLAVLLSALAAVFSGITLLIVLIMFLEPAVEKAKFELSKMADGLVSENSDSLLAIVALPAAMIIAGFVISHLLIPNAPGKTNDSITDDKAPSPINHS